MGGGFIDARSAEKGSTLAPEQRSYVTFMRSDHKDNHNAVSELLNLHIHSETMRL